MTLKQARKNAGLTLKQVAKKLNITSSTVAKYENGIIVPKINQINILLKLYGIQYEELDLSNG